MNDGGPAFPRPSGEAHDAAGNQFWPCANDGMSLRDYFAAQALSGYLARKGDWQPRSLAWVAYEIADAMLEKRDGTTATTTEAREPTDG